MHLREAEPGGDRRLAEPVPEAKRDDPPLARGKSAERPRDGDAILGGSQRVGLVREPVLLQRHHERRRRGRDVLPPRPGGAGPLLVGGRAAEPGHELPIERGKRASELVNAARRAHGLDPVPEVPPQLAVDRRHGEGDEVLAATGIEPVDRGEERHRADLLQVLERLAAAAVSACERRHEREMQLHEPAARIRVAVAVGSQVAAALRLDL